MGLQSVRSLGAYELVCPLSYPLPLVVALLSVLPFEQAPSMSPLARVQATGKIHIYREAGYWWYLLPTGCKFADVLETGHFTRWLNRNHINKLRTV